MHSTARDGGGASAFVVGRRRGVWQVVRDGVFYGDFPVRQSAMNAAQVAARLPLDRATPAEIRVCEDEA
jgi:hypothetical protein